MSGSGGAERELSRRRGLSRGGRPVGGRRESLIDTPKGLGKLVEKLREEPRYAIDTEFHRERTYFPQLALVQLAWSDGGLALVDPTKLDLTPFREILEGPGTAVLHASDQDLEVLELACGAVPQRLFDTQVAAGFLGLSSPSLASLYLHTLGVMIPKAERLTDWLARPLSSEQIDYAISDVDRLLDVYDHLCKELEERGRLQWALDECEQLRSRDRTGRDPEDAWRRIKDARQLRGRPMTIAQGVAAWRENRAAEINLPPRYVISDLGVVGISQRPPHSVEELLGMRGIEDRHLGGQHAQSLFEAIEEARSRPITRNGKVQGRDMSRYSRPAVSLVSAWVGQLARDLDIETSLLATRSDLEALLRGDPDAKLTKGWRAELVGEPVRKLTAGEAALAFDGKGALCLEERSGQILS